MIPNFKLDNFKFNIDNNKYSGMLHLKYEQDKDKRNLITTSGDIIIDNIIHSINSVIGVISAEKKLRIVGMDTGKRIDLSFIPLITKKPKAFKFQIIGQYGSSGIFKTLDMSMKNINISANLVIDNITRPINLTFGSGMTSDRFIISGVDNIANKRFSISITPKFGIKMKYQISGMYGSKTLADRVINSDINLLKEILKEIKDNIIV